jgi:pSer/pThr/pTyr-binding forkhead associated (FHA) protein
MNAEPDVYTRWLAMESGPRPPHYYDLLGLPLFTVEREQIESAARKQFRRIKPFQDHEDRDTREAVQDVMNRIASARVTLTDPNKKDSYDRTLAKALGVDREAVVSERVAQPLPEYQLMVTSGPAMVGRSFDIAEGTILSIGRSPDCTVHLDSMRVANHHASIQWGHELDWTIQTDERDAILLVNDHREISIPLQAADKIDIGGFRLRFVATAEAAYLRKRTPRPISLMVRRGPTALHPVHHAMAPEQAVIGNDPTSDWQLPGHMISRHHARLGVSENQWVIEDLRSTNGTIVNGARIERVVLQNGDEIDIGDFTIAVRIQS